MLIESILICALFVETFLVIWFKSPLQMDLQCFTKIPFHEYLQIRFPLLAKLSGCHICVSFWLSLFIGTFCFGLGWFFLTIPGALYVINRKIFEDADKT